MSLVFNQKNDKVPNEVFLVMCRNGHPEAILEIPDDEEEALLLKNRISSDIYQVVTLNFNDLIAKGYDLLM